MEGTSAEIAAGRCEAGGGKEGGTDTRAWTTRERERRARVSGCHAGSTCQRGRRRARALLGLRCRWAERKVEEEATPGKRKAGHVREKKRRVGRGEAGERAG
jgi:hypothetical protein